jgi:hypothetical protein
MVLRGWSRRDVSLCPRIWPVNDVNTIPDQLKGYSTMHMNRVDCTVNITDHDANGHLANLRVPTPYMAALAGVASCRMFLGGRCSSEALSFRNSL